MNYSTIKKYDIANYVGLRCSIFFCGCKHGCKGCFNSELWNFNSGKPFDREAKEKVISLLLDEHCGGKLSILGGEPLQQDLDEMKSFLTEVRERVPNAHIALWTGYYLHELNIEQQEIIALCDVVVDGRFDEDLKDKKLLFRGSSNQTIWENVNGKFVKSDKN